MCSPWSENFLRNCEKVSNVTLVCKDGKLTSHKIVLARISDYIRDLMLLIPNEEDIIIMLPDFPIKIVRDFVTKHIFKDFLDTHNKSNQIDFSELKAVLGSNEKKASVVKCDVDLNIKDDFKDDFKGHVDVVTDFKEEETEYFSPNDEDYDDDQEQYDPPQTIKKEKKEPRAKKQNKKAEKRQMKVEDILNMFPPGFNADELSEDEVIEDTGNLSLGKKLKLEKRKKYNLARKALLRGEFNSIRGCASKFGLSESTLRKLVRSGRNYSGRGKGFKFFSEQEELLIKDRIIARAGGESNLTFQIVKQCLNEEYSILRINHPEKNLPEILPCNFPFNFSKRNGLTKIISEKLEEGRKDRRNFECEICYKKFTWKNALVGHQKTVHASFFNRPEQNSTTPDSDDKKSFECEICYKKFIWKNALVSHQKSVHSAFFQRPEQELHNGSRGASINNSQSSPLVSSQQQFISNLALFCNSAQSK